MSPKPLNVHPGPGNTPLTRSVPVEITMAAKTSLGRIVPSFPCLATLFAGGVTAAIASLWSPDAHASAAYAYLLSSEFGFGGGCEACHNTVSGGAGTVKKPFGITLMGFGLVGDNTDSLYQAVTTLDTSNADSDGDSIADFDELSPDGDPNDPTVFPPGATPLPPAPTPPPAPPASATPPTTPPPPAPAPASESEDGGCSLQPHGATGIPWGLVALGVGLGLQRRRPARRTLFAHTPQPPQG